MADVFTRMSPCSAFVNICVVKTKIFFFFSVVLYGYLRSVSKTFLGGNFLLSIFLQLRTPLYYRQSLTKPENTVPVFLNTENNFCFYGLSPLLKLNHDHQGVRNSTYSMTFSLHPSEPAIAKRALNHFTHCPVDDSRRQLCSNIYEKSKLYNLDENI